MKSSDGKIVFVTFHSKIYSQTSMRRISPISHSAMTSNGRQQTSQSVVNRCSETLVSKTTVEVCPQKGHAMDSAASIRFEEWMDKLRSSNGVGQ